MTHRFQKSHQTIPLEVFENKMAMIDIIELMQKMPLCDPQSCKAFREGRCQITDLLTDKTKVCIPERLAKER